MPLITHLGLTQQSNYFGHTAPFHCFNGEYKGIKLAIVTNGKDRKFGCDNVRWEGFATFFLSSVRSHHQYPAPKCTKLCSRLQPGRIN